MMMRLRDLRQLVREELMRVPAIVTVDQLSAVQNELDDALVAGHLTTADYEREWLETLRSVGWTPEMYAREVDRRWDYVGSGSEIPPARAYGSN